MKQELHAYSNIIASYIIKNNVANNGNFRPDSIIALFPHDIRITVIAGGGKVIFDNNVSNEQKMDNHIERPEVANARINGNGGNIRLSKTTGLKYYYYAVNYGKFFVRTALPYKISASMINPDMVMSYLILLLFFGGLISILYVTDRFGKSITLLKDFIISAERGNIKEIKFPESDLGEIGEKIILLFKQLEGHKNKLKMEQDKLIRHFHYSEEGICIFDPKHIKNYANSHFVQYVNTILDKPCLDMDNILEEDEFKDVRIFLKRNIDAGSDLKKNPVYEAKISKSGQHFAIRLLIFPDKSYEMILNNISSNEKNRLLKQEMTNNIAHELKTPVSSIRGYVETMLEQDNIEPEKRHFFLNRTYTQVIRLSDLIRDIALITKTEEAPDMFENENISIRDIIDEVVGDISKEVKAHNISLNNNVSETVILEGNKTLLYSIFRNLIDNSINYAGDNIEINIAEYSSDSEYYYFRFYDTGMGISEEHLSKIFNRFYRISEGRSRKTGGSGLGLSIVRNAILFHKGSITAKNRPEGGLEFIFSLKKELF